MKIYIQEKIVPKYTCKSSQDVYDLMKRERVHLLEREVFWVMALNVKNQVNKLIPISIGTADSAMVHPRDVFRELIVLNASGFIVIHNHPSGVSQPSQADIDLTLRLQKAAATVGIDLVDSIVIGDEEYFSLKEGGLLA